MSDLLPLLIAESVLLFVALIALPAGAMIMTWIKVSNGRPAKLKGLALPQGSVRSMLALTIIGSFVILLVFGGYAQTANDNFSEVVAALTGIAGTVVGFYFGSGGSGSSSEAGRNAGVNHGKTSDNARGSDNS